MYTHAHTLEDSYTDAWTYKHTETTRLGVQKIS